MIAAISEMSGAKNLDRFYTWMIREDIKKREERLPQRYNPFESPIEGTVIARTNYIYISRESVFMEHYQDYLYIPSESISIEYYWNHIFIPSESISIEYYYYIYISSNLISIGYYRDYIYIPCESIAIKHYYYIHIPSESIFSLFSFSIISRHLSK